MSPVVKLLSLFLLPALLAGQKPGLQAGFQDRVMKVGDKEREYVLYIPKNYKAKQKPRLPLVLMLHGMTSNGRQAARYYGWTQLADKEAFFAVFPTALGQPTSWKAGFAGRRPTEDSKFLAELIDAMIEEFGIDKDRVFMTGHSSGGFMSYSFATTHAEKVAAIGPVAGLNVSRGKPKVPISVISFHGMADDVVAYGEGHGAKARYRGMPSAVQSAATIAKHNGCEEKPKRKDIQKGEVHIDSWVDGKAGTEVVLYSIVKGGHGWPRGRRDSVPATQLIWEFFKTHPRGSAEKKGAVKKQKQPVGK